MMNPEGGIIRAGVEITTRVTSDGEMASSVDTNTSTGTAEATTSALHHVLEGKNVTAVGDEGGNVLGAGVAGGEVVGDVTAKATGVQTVAIGAGVARRGRVDGRGDGAKADSHAAVITLSASRDLTSIGKWENKLLERSGLDAAATVAGGSNTGRSMIDLLAVSTERSVATIKDRRLLGVLSPTAPVPILYFLVSLETKDPNPYERRTGWLPL